MKKFILALVTLFTLTVSANAMSYEQARQQALFLTDKMAYELNLTDEQYEAAYEINLDYLMSVNDYSDLYGVYWSQRNLDLSYGNTEPIAQPTISIAHSIITTATGASESMPVTHIETTSISVGQVSMPSIAVDTAGESMADKVGIAVGISVAETHIDT